MRFICDKDLLLIDHQHFMHIIFVLNFQALKQELVDTRDEHNRERRELEMSQNDLIK